MDLEILHVLEKHIFYWGDPITMAAYMGNCEPCILGLGKLREVKAFLR